MGGGVGSSELSAAIWQLAGQLGVSPPLEYIDDGRTYDFLICLGDSCVPLTDTPYTRVQILDNGVRITSDTNSRSGSPSVLQEPGLCTIAAALPGRRFFAGPVSRFPLRSLRSTSL